MFPEIVVLRHGQTEWNRARRWQGGLDSPLTALGREQARRMGAVLREAEIGPASHAAFVSPLGRTLETARLALGPDWPLRPDPRLREIGVGAWQGWTLEEIRAAAGLPEGASIFDYYRAAPGGEGFEALAARARAFLESLEGPAVIVTHGMTSRMLRTLASGGDPAQIDALPGGQGVVFRVRAGVHEVLGAA
ncbi:MAG: histidine phosphatase family protein [Alphaproteobacteria bacterium]|nr:MAG: histidine phosphatase family protein [Alphaproteobacteria bacterium]